MLKPLFRKFLRRPFYFFQDFLKIPSYTRPQIYTIDYSVTLTNTSAELQKFSLILPIPANTEYQTILEEPKFSEKASIGQEEFFKNKFASWQVTLKKGESQVFHEVLKVKIQPARHKLKKKYSLKEYKLTPELRQQYLTANRFIGSNDSRIKQIASQLVREDDVVQTVRNINRFVIKYLTYKNPILGLYSYQEALEKKEVDCGGFDALFVSLCQAAGIPARIVSGFFVGRTKNSMHAWCEWMLPDGQWIPADPSVEHQYKKGEARKSGYLGFCGSNRLAFSYGCDLALPLPEIFRTDILQNPILIPHSPAIRQEIELTTS